jgi:hypothetical protein
MSLAEDEQQTVGTLFVSWSGYLRWLDMAGACDMPFAFGDPERTRLLAALLPMVQRRALDLHDIATLDESTSAFIQDVVTLTSGQPELETERRYLLLKAALAPMELGVARRQLEVTRAWALRSIGVPDDSGEVVDPKRFEVFRDISDAWLANDALQIQLRWARSLYWYSWATGHLDEIAIPFAAVMSRLSIAVVQLPRLAEDIVADAIDAAVATAQWGLRRKNEKLAAQIVTTLAPVLADQRRPRPHRKSVAVAIAVALGESAAVDPRAAAQQALDEFGDLLEGHEPFQLLVNAVGRDPDLLAARIDELVSSANAYADDFTGVPTLDAEYARGRMFAIVLPILRLLLRGEWHAEAARLLAAWLGLPQARADLVWLLWSFQEGVAWATVDGFMNVAMDPRTFDSLGDEINAALGLGLTNATAPDPPGTYVRTDRRTDHGRSARLEARSLERLALPAAARLLSAARERGGALIPVPWLPVPAQALMLRELSFALPVSASLVAPRSDRPMTRAALWAAGVPSGGLEIAAVQRLLAEADVASDVFDSGLSSTLFATIYQDPDYDLVWVASHGSSGGVWPERSAIQLSRSPEVTMDLEALVALEPPHGDRRLLVLNTCESGSAAILGGPLRFGIAAQLASPSQAVIAHLWPVRDLAAGLFGVLLARHLREGQGFFRAFELAMLDRIAAGARPDELLDADDPIQADMRLQLGADGDDPQALLHWASPAFFE